MSFINQVFVKGRSDRSTATIIRSMGTEWKGRKTLYRQETDKQINRTTQKLQIYKFIYIYVCVCTT